MHRHLYTSLLFCACTFSHAQLELTQPSEAATITVSEKTIFYKLAESTIPVKIQRYGDRNDIVFINLHDDEFTSVEAAKKLLEEYGGILIEIENKLQRNIRFQLDRYSYKIDPNQIFSKQGVKRSLEQFGKTSSRAIDEVEKFGQRILQLIPAEASYIISLHNNTPGFFSARDYGPGNTRSFDSKKIYINNMQDPDDFFLTTDDNLYEKLADKGFNTILQDNKNCSEDGSLSVYCGKNNIRYINCETEHGKMEQYYEMMKALLKVIEQ